MLSMSVCYVQYIKDMINIYLAQVWVDPAIDQNFIQPHASASNTKNILAPLLYISREHPCRRILQGTSNLDSVCKN